MAGGIKIRKLRVEFLDKPFSQPVKEMVLVNSLFLDVKTKQLSHH
jgi:hypothetical protein